MGPDMVSIAGYGWDMTEDRVSTTMVTNAPAEAIFVVLADPAKHAAIDGTGWVRGTRDSEPLSGAGQIIRMAMYHANHPDGSCRTANRVREFDPPSVISREPAHEAEDGALRFGGWIWRYDLAPAGPSITMVTLSYDWSEVPDSIRAYIGFPPFPPEHLGNALAHLAGLVSSWGAAVHRVRPRARALSAMD
jgi:hypothetical protein